jgi:hypothetical protein
MHHGAFVAPWFNKGIVTLLPVAAPVHSCFIQGIASGRIPDDQVEVLTRPTVCAMVAFTSDGWQVHPPPGKPEKVVDGIGTFRLAPAADGTQHSSSY